MPIIKTKRKVLSLGDSLAMTLPSIYIRLNNINKGETLDAYYFIDDFIIICNKGKKQLKKGLEEFIKELEDHK